MFDELDNRLADWARSTLDGVFVSLAPPSEPDHSGQDRGVSIYLFELVNDPPARGSRRPAIQIVLRYLVTAWAPKPEDSHKMLGTLFVEAASNPELEVEQDTIPTAIWSAFEIAPRPAFVIRMPFRHEVPERLAPPVTKPMVIRQSPLSSLTGKVYGPGNIPVVEARVELPSLSMHTYTDFQGQFQFAMIPAEPHSKHLIVRAKGREFSITTDQAGPASGLLLIELKLEE